MSWLDVAQGGAKQLMSKPIPKPSFDRKPRAGELRHFANGRTLFVAPLPLPTGHPPVDWAGSIIDVNDVYLDVGATANNKVFQVQMVAFLIIFSLLAFLVVAPGHMYFYVLNSEYSEVARQKALGILNGGLWVFKYLILPMGVMLAATVWHTTYIKGRICPLRFNRQRREVCLVPEKSKTAMFVPWEELVVWVSSAVTSTGQTLIEQHLFGMAARDQKGVIQTFTHGTVSPDLALGKWEAIRAFMEKGPDHTVAPAEGEGKATFDHNRWMLHENYRSGEHSLLWLVGWYLWHLFTLWRFPYWIAEWDKNYKPRPLPKEALEWSKPLPKEQWAQPSDELVRETANIEQAMAEGCSFNDYLNGKWEPSGEPGPQTGGRRPVVIPPRKGPDGKYLKR